MHLQEIKLDIMVAGAKIHQAQALWDALATLKNLSTCELSVYDISPDMAFVFQSVSLLTKLK